MKRAFKDLYLQSNKVYKPEYEYAWGIECENKIYKRNVILVMEDRLDKLVKLVQQGWIIIPGITKWILRSPEASLYDLSEVHKNPSLDPIYILAFYRYLKEKGINQVIKRTLENNKFDDFQYLILPSKSYFESCCRIAGSDKRVKLLHQLIFIEIQKDKDWSKYIQQTQDILRPRKFEIKTKEFNQCSKQTQQFLSNILDKYKYLSRPIKTSWQQIYLGFWKDIPQYDNYFFIPLRGFAFMTGYMEEMKKHNNLSLWEYHSSVIDYNKEIIWTNYQPKQHDRLAVVDVAYSGRTISYTYRKTNSGIL